MCLTAVPAEGQTNWVRLFGPLGSATSLATDGAGNVFAATDAMSSNFRGFIYKYAKDRQLWEETNLYYEDSVSRSMTFASDGALLVADASNNPRMSGSLRRADPNVSEWVSLVSLPDVFVCSVVDVGGGRIYLGTSSGVYVSDDNGASFTLFGLEGEKTCTLTSGNDRLYSGTSIGLQISSLIIDDWQLTAYLDSTVQDIEIGVDGTVYIGSSAGLFRSGALADQFSSLGFSGDWVSAVTQTSLGELLVGASQSQDEKPGRVYSSTDSGQTWTSVASGGGPVHQILDVPQTGTFAASFRGIYFRDLGSHEFQDSGIPNTTDGKIRISSAGTLYAGSFRSGSRGLFYSSDQGESWDRLTDRSSFALSSDGTLYSIFGEDIIVYNAEREVLHADKKFPDPVFSGPVFNSKGDLYVITYSGHGTPNIVSVSRDRGSSWLPVGSQVEFASSLAVDPADRLWITAGYALYVSDGNGENWTLVIDQIPGTNELIRSIFFSEKNFVFVSAGHLFRATYSDALAGVGFEIVYENGEIVDMTENSVGGLFVASSTGGILASYDFGNTWEPFEEGLDDPTSFLDVRSLVSDESGNIYAGTNQFGVWRTAESTLGTITSSEKIVPIQTSLSLDVFPNPVGQRLRVKYEISTSGRTVLKLFDLLGRHVSTIVDEVQSVGNHVADVDFSEFTPGIYLLRLETGSLTISQKVIHQHGF